MLALSFFLIALVYALVGFGGGTSYLALLSMYAVPFQLIPKIGLICNLLVVSGGCWHYFKNGHFNSKLILPLVLSSVPMAFLGGFYPVSEKVFFILLTASLILAGLRLLFEKKVTIGDTKPPGLVLAIPTGALLGFLSGIVGIGGGIFLAPIMLNLKWAPPKQVAATASAFIFLNSLAGLSGQMLKGFQLHELNPYLLLFAAVVIGGQIGSRIGSHPRVSQSLIQRSTAGLILFVSYKLLGKTLGL
jgi:uncharacterized membrane protein YfcA